MDCYVCMQGRRSLETYDHHYDFSKFCFYDYESFVVLVKLLVFDFFNHKIDIAFSALF